MTAFMWQVLSVMTFLPMLAVSLLVSLFLVSRVLRPWPWGWLAAPGSSSLLLLHDWLVSGRGSGPRLRSRPLFPFWEELPAWALAGAVSTLLFYLTFYGVAWTFRRLLAKLPGPPR